MSESQLHQLGDAQPHPNADVVALDQLKRGDCAQVVSVEADSNDIQRLQAMGLCAGRNIELIKQGDPMILRVFASRVGVSRRLGERVMVRACGGHEPDAPNEGGGPTP